MVYDSTNSFYKSPYGAVPAGETVTFKIKLHGKYCNCSPRFIIHLGDKAYREFEMTKESQEGDMAVFSLNFVPANVGVYYYYFDLFEDYMKIYKGKNCEGVMSTDNQAEYQLTVFEKDFSTPKNFLGGVMYQIFPDRFYEDKPKETLAFTDRVYRKDKDGEPYFWPTEKGGHLNQDYFGGTLKGITEKLDYLKNLGITILYLNPIFEAHSNHRYNTANYMNIDPDLGTEQDFIDMCKACKEKGIKVVLDGVFSHTGSDSIYFNKEQRYQEDGAYANANSFYRSWFDFNNGYKCGYRSWWGFETLPEVNENDPSFRNFICGENGVIEKWLGLGADGFRLDVADELPDDFIEDIRTTIKRCGDDKLLIGEVWEDASNKFSYGSRRTYLLGKGLDTVMNYPFRDAAIKYIKYNDVEGCAEIVNSICENYPKPAVDTLMNFLSTHDTERIITALVNEDIRGRDRYWQSGRRLNETDLELGKMLLKLCYAFLFFLPGNPCIYYGDEISMEGYKDPFNRGYYNWNETDDRLANTIKALGKMRKKCSAFKDGGIKIIKAENNVLVMRRFNQTESCEICINRTPKPVFVDLLGKQAKVLPFNFELRFSK